jgi:hypothetical protein
MTGPLPRAVPLSSVRTVAKVNPLRSLACGLGSGLGLGRSQLRALSFACLQFETLSASKHYYTPPLNTLPELIYRGRVQRSKIHNSHHHHWKKWLADLSAPPSTVCLSTTSTRAQLTGMYNRTCLWAVYEEGIILLDIPLDWTLVLNFAL